MINKSSIPVHLLLDLRREDENPNAVDGVECLEVNVEEENDDESLLHSIINPDENVEESAIQSGVQDISASRIKLVVDDDNNDSE